MPVLTGIDIIGIQSYIYASNRLRDVLAASYMVRHVTSHKMLVQWGLSADRVLLAAGGNGIVEFDSEDDARRWTALYTRCLLDTVPGLDAVVAHRNYERGKLAWALKALQMDLTRAKLERRPSVPQLGLSVTASCTITGLPAKYVDKGDLVSSSIIELRRQNDDAKTSWDEFLSASLDPARGWRPEFPDVLDFMGRTSGHTSLVGVVHVDGNGVGDAIQEWLARCIDRSANDDEVREEYRTWSYALIERGASMLHGVVKRIIGCIEEDKDGHDLRGTPHHLGFPLNHGSDDRQTPAKETVFLPLRPILLGGDDLTFVCDGRIALDLAVTALRTFAEHPLPQLGRLTACAGVALVKAHAPFRSSYHLAEDLCQSAKTSRKQAQQSNMADDCWLDWHVGVTRPGDSIQDVRERQYRCRDGYIATMRPYRLGAHGSRVESWQWLDRTLLGPGDGSRTNDQSFRGASHWVNSRNRVKQLSSLVSDGGSGIGRQLGAWKVVEPQITLPGGLDTSADQPGFIGPRTPLRDAIELMDLHMRLERDLQATDTTPIGATLRAGTEEDR